MSPPTQAIAKAVVVTAVTSLFFAGVFFYFFHKFVLARYYRRNKLAERFLQDQGQSHIDIHKFGGNVKGLIVEENGVGVLYMLDSECKQTRSGFPNSIFNPSFEDDEEEKRIIDVLLQKQHLQYSPELALSLPPLPIPSPMIHPPPPPPPPPPLLLPPPPPPSSLYRAPPPPPPSSLYRAPPPPPPSRKEIPKPPPLPSSDTKHRKGAASPPLPSSDTIHRKGAASPPSPPPFPTSALFSSLKRPPGPKGKPNKKITKKAAVGESSREKGPVQTRLKPLHWDKIVANVDHSTVWDEINDGSFRVDDELMESLFGYSSGYRTNETNKALSNLAKSNSSTPSQIFILEPRKSQNTAIVLRSLAVSRKEILEALIEGKGLSVETLERLTKIAPSQEEEAKIIQFSGNPDKLADAESFLYYILKEVPTAFNRLKAMIFRSTYDCEVLQLKENLQTIEMGCKELRNSVLFLKLLEAILKAGNRMNAGTSRGNAQGFNLSALRKLSDIKSTDGKTSLLHFIVQQVVQSEGKREIIYQKLNGEIIQESEKECLMLGLPVLGGLSYELYEAKKVSGIEYHNFITMCSNLSAHVGEIRQIITCCGNTEKSEFTREMKGFLEECEEELKVVKEEQTRIMELVRKTNEYYLAGAISKENMLNPFQLFVIVKDFADMVDQACIELKRKIEKKSVGGEAEYSTPPLSPSKRTALRFPNFDLYFLSNRSEATSCSQSEDDF